MRSSWRWNTERMGRTRRRCGAGCGRHALTAATAQRPELSAARRAEAAAEGELRAAGDLGAGPLLVRRRRREVALQQSAQLSPTTRVSLLIRVKKDMPALCARPRRAPPPRGVGAPAGTPAQFDPHRTQAGRWRIMRDDPRPVSPYGVGYALTGPGPPIHHQLSRPGKPWRRETHPQRAMALAVVW